MIGTTRQAVRPAAPLPSAALTSLPLDNEVSPPRGVARTVLATLFLGLVVVGGVAAMATHLLPLGDWLAAVAPKAEVAGTIAAARIETAPRGFARRWRANADQLVVKVAPYSFGFAVRCDDRERCNEMLGQIRRGIFARLVVDKAGFEEFRPANRAVTSRDPGRAGQQIIAAELDTRRVAMYRLETNGAVVFGDD
ncbi:MAG: hypothetical protein IT562_21540 [Alphaproteobacteria bacterium]|nr:hypothetical protein [Alphaproteobacteria bacterium]